MERLSLREFLDKREAEIKQLMSELKQELKELRAAKSAILPESQKLNIEAMTDGSDRTRTPTIKEMAMSVLRAHGGTGTAEDIINWIALDFSKDIARSSLSPQLSRLKSDGEIDLNHLNGRWGITNPDAEDLTENSGLDLAAQDAHLP